MSTSEQIEPILIRLRKERYPDSFTAALSAYLTGSLSIDQLQPEINQLPSWQRHLPSDWSWKPDGLDWEVLLRLVSLHGRIQIQGYLRPVLESELAPRVAAALRAGGMAEVDLLDLLLQHHPRLHHHNNGTLLPVGQVLQDYVKPEAADAAWQQLLTAAQRQPNSLVLGLELTTMLLKQTPPQIDRAWQFVQATGRGQQGEVVALLVRADPARFTEHARMVAALPHKHYDHCDVLKALMELDPQRHVDLAVAAVCNPAMQNAHRMRRAGLRLAVRYNATTHWPLLEAAGLGTDEHLGQEALELLKELPFDTALPLLQRIVAEGMIELAEPALKNILLVRDWPEKRAYVRDVLAHRSKVLRDLATAWLGTQGEAVLDELAPVLKHSNADARLAAVEALKRIGGPRAAALSRACLDNERSAKVRRAILDIAGAATENAPSQEAALLAEAETTLRKVAATLPEGLDLAAFPLRWASGAPLPEAVARFLIYRQSRAKPNQLDARIAAALALIDHNSTGELALALWQGWLARGAPNQEARMLPLIGALGDERLVPLLRDQISNWAKTNRRQLTLPVVAALAFQGGDMALGELDSLVLHAKSPRLRMAADQALADAAQRQGCSRADLLDRATPRLGFDPRGERTLSYGARLLTVRLLPDTMLELRDADGRSYANPPKPRATDDPALAAAAQAEWKRLRTEVKQAFKRLLDRLERSMIHQRAWDAARWQTLFLEHPLLRIAARSLIWVLDTPDNETTPKPTFRPLEDGTLTDTEDEPVALPPGAQVRLAHPLLLDEPTRAAWRQHLADYAVTQPFPQIDRPYVALPEEARDQRRWSDPREHVVNSAKLAARAAKTGWFIGAPMDGGVSHTLWTYYPEAGLDAVIGLVRGMQAGLRHTYSSGLGDLAFFPSPGPGQHSRRDYLSENDPDALPLGSVPPVLFSEAAVALRAFAAEGVPDPDWFFVMR